MHAPAWSRWGERRVRPNDRRLANGAGRGDPACDVATGTRPRMPPAPSSLSERKSRWEDYPIPQPIPGAKWGIYSSTCFSDDLRGQKFARFRSLQQAARRSSNGVEDRHNEHAGIRAPAGRGTWHGSGRGARRGAHTSGTLDGHGSEAVSVQRTSHPEVGAVTARICPCPSTRAACSLCRHDHEQSANRSTVTDDGDARGRRRRLRAPGLLTRHPSHPIKTIPRSLRATRTSNRDPLG